MSRKNFGLVLQRNMPTRPGGAFVRFMRAYHAHSGNAPRIAMMGRKDYEALAAITRLSDDQGRPILRGLALEYWHRKRTIEVA